MKNPRVSVCIPAFRQPALVKRAVASVFSQTFQDFEIVITDDSEFDEVAEAISAWHGDPRLVYRRNSTRLGSPENWNASMRLARSELIKFLHHDDWFSQNNALERFVAVMDANPHINFSFSACNACEDDGQLIFVHKPQAAQIKLLRKHPWALQFGNFIGAPSVTIFRRQTDFQFDSRLRWVVDIDGYLKLLGGCPQFVFLAEPLVCISANGAHQVTRSVAADSASRILEHLHLYAIHTPPNLKGRIKGFLFIYRLLAGSRNIELTATTVGQGARCRSHEEEIAFLTLRVKSTLATFLVNAIKKVRNIFASRKTLCLPSYAQCGEDMIVNFLFMWLGGGKITYLDIGAHHPTLLSNTYHFYRAGHRGVLIEPDADLCQAIEKKRPEDKVLNLAVSPDGDAMIPMYVMTSRTLNTLDKNQAKALQVSGHEKIEAVREVRNIGINLILAEYFSSAAPDFVSIDIEGLDFPILQAWDFNRFRPKVFCVETLTYTRDNSERKLTEIIDLMISRRYRIYADTFINTIFVCEDAWKKRPLYA